MFHARRRAAAPGIRNICALMPVALGTSAVLAGGATLNVPGDFATIQACIDAAADGDECVVAPGTYHELIDFDGKTITLRSTGGPEVTIIDAGPVADPGTGKPVIRCVNGEGLHTRLDGFTITGGTGDTTLFPDVSFGGGIFTLFTSPTVINCVFSGNTAGVGGGMGVLNGGPVVTDCMFISNSTAGNGGGLLSESGSPTVSGCTFTANIAGNGGGMYSESGSPTVTDCTFNTNDADRGGGMYNESNSVVVTGCAFISNNADRGGGMYNKISSPAVSDCTFTENTGRFSAGGMYNQNSDTSIDRCTFDRNVALFGCGGGMDNVASSGPTVRHCTFSGNSALNGGGMCNGSQSETRVEGCSFIANATDGSGGGISAGNSSLALSNCLFAGNTADDSGGGINNIFGASTAVTNCTFSGNTALDGDGGALFAAEDSSPTVSNCVFFADSPDELFGAGEAAIAAAFSNVQGGHPGAGNIDKDPRFVDANGPDNDPETFDDNDYRLSAHSPCIDAGDNTTVPADVLIDLAGRPRFFDDRRTRDTGNGTPPHVDMGAFEFGAGVCADGRTLTVLLCHQPAIGPSNPRTIRVRLDDVLDHFAHGDTCGRCPESTTVRDYRSGARKSP